MNNLHTREIARAILVITLLLSIVPLPTVLTVGDPIVHLTVSPSSVTEGDTVTSSWWIENVYIEWTVEVNFYIYNPSSTVVEDETYGWNGVGLESNPVTKTWQVPKDAEEGEYTVRVEIYWGMFAPVNGPAYAEKPFSVNAPPPPEFDFDLYVDSSMRINVGDLLLGSVTEIVKGFKVITTLTEGDTEQVDLTCDPENPTPGVSIAINPPSGYPTFDAELIVTVTGTPAIGYYSLHITASNSVSKGVTRTLELFVGPEILDFSPKNAYAGVEVEITGTNLAGGRVYLGDYAASPMLPDETGGSIIIDEATPHGKWPLRVVVPGGDEFTTVDEIEIFPRPWYSLEWGFKFHNPSQNSLSYPHWPGNEGRYRDCFGTEQVYWDLLGAPYAPDPLAEGYYWALFEWLAKPGECFGMSAASLLLHHQAYSGWDTYLTPQYFDPTATRVNELDQSDGRLDRLIDYTHGIQVSLECILEILDSATGGPGEVLSRVRNAIDSGEYGIISIVVPPKGGVRPRGHAMVPYLVEDVDDQHTRIYVYDPNREEFSTESIAEAQLASSDDANNYPPYITIDKTGLWDWTFEWPDGEIWRGWHTEGAVSVIPYTPISFVPYYCLLDRTLPVSWEGLLDFLIDVGLESLDDLINYIAGDAAVQIEDEQGRCMGVDGEGNWYMEIPNGAPIPAPEVRGYFLPFGDYTAHIRGMAGGTYSWGTFCGASSLFAIEDADATSNTEDTVHLSYQDGNPLAGVVSFSTSDPSKEYSAAIIVQRDAVQRVYRIKDATISHGSHASFEVSQDFNSLIYTNTSPDTITYNVEFQICPPPQDGGDGELPTLTRTIVIGPYEQHILTPENWLDLAQSEVNLGEAEVNVPGDLNNDRKIDILDIAIVAFAFGCKPGDVNWNIIADLNQDEIINVLDISIVAMKFGTSFE